MKVVVTRPRDQAGPLVQRLEALGHEVVACPLIEIEPSGPAEVDVSGYDWVIVTSPNGARELVGRARGLWPKVAAVGPGTAEALREEGIEPALVPRVSSQDGLLAEFPRSGGRVLFAAAEGARRRPIEELDADFVPLYRTRLVRPDQVPEGDVVVLASGSAARSFAALGVRIPAISIGPETTRAAEREGLEVVAEAATHNLDGLIVAVEQVALTAEERGSGMATQTEDGHSPTS
jgi:uroporphyrinogen-III synthase